MDNVILLLNLTVIICGMIELMLFGILLNRVLNKWI